VDEIFYKAAKSAIVTWGAAQSWESLEEDTEDLVQDLWVWYHERPSTQDKLDTLSEGQAVRTVRMICNQILSERVLSGNRFNGRSLYSSDAVREALHGLSSNKYLREMLPLALEAVQHRDEALEDRGYAEAIRLRYEDKQIPEQGADHVRLVRAIKSLTDEINIMHLTSNQEGIGSRGEVFPGSRRASGGYHDPTGDIAMLLIEHPEVRDDYLEVTGIDNFLKGRSVDPQHI